MINEGTFGDWLETHSECGGGIDWHRVRFANSMIGWMRSDYLLKTDNSGSIILDTPTPTAIPARTDKYILPCPGTFTGGWLDYGGQHKGWDIANSIGIPIYGQNGGQVYETKFCEKCGEAGLSSYPANVIGDRGWNGGWGHYVVAWYPKEMLPAFTQSQFPGLDAFVLYGHLSKITSKAGDPIQIHTQLGLMGNSGNSSGPHTHVELRMAAYSNLGWSRLGASVDPGFLFAR